MNAIIYYSNTNESYNIAKYIYSKTNYLLIDINKLKDYEYNNIFLIFPIHYQSIPKSIRGIIKKIIAKKAIVIATYGKMSYGNILCETKKMLQAKIVAAAIVPSKHPYIVNDTKYGLTEDYVTTNYSAARIQDNSIIYLEKINCENNTAKVNKFSIANNTIVNEILETVQISGVGQINNCE